MIKKIKEVDELFHQIDYHISVFKKNSCISCIPNCGDCCKKDGIEATVLEFLPAAYSFYLSGTYDTILEKIETKNDNICVSYNPFSENGFCSNYESRGLICRLFGFSTRVDKNGQFSLVTCRKIKDIFQYKPGPIVNLKEAPQITSWYMKLYGIEPKLSTQYLPINLALKKALEIVLFYFQYKKKRA